MKPMQLTICGWGPFKEETKIDFTAFEGKGLFLITGQTGAGKTTVFDAITYALYGTMSGNMREKGSVRSDFADADTKTFVRLVMSHGGKIYTVTRNPEYERPKKRKTGKTAFTKEKENAVLCFQDGTAVEGTTEVNQRLREILRLDEKQFKQISMIAQGEFARMLSASGAEKTRIFREIFGTGIYSRLAEKLKERANELYKRVMEYRHRMEEDVRLFTIEEDEWKSLTDGEEYHYASICEFLLRKKAEWKQEAERIKVQNEALEEELFQLNRAFSEAKAANELLGKLAGTAKRREESLQKESEQKERKQERERAEAAEAVYPAKLRLKQFEEQMKAGEKRLEEILEEIRQLVKEEEELQKLRENREQIYRAFELEESYAEAETECAGLKKELVEREKELALLQKQFLIKEEETGRKRKIYEEADSRYKRAAVGIAARLLREGEPCPVCGSLSHPKVAEVSEEIPSEEELTEWKKQYERSEQEKQQIFVRTQTALHKKQETHEMAEKWKQKLLEIEQERQKLSDFVKETVKKPYQQERRRFEEKLERFTRLHTLREEKQQAAEKNKQENVQKKEELRTALLEWEKALSEHGFASEEDFEKSRRSLKERKELEERAAAYLEEKNRLETLFVHLSKEAEGKQYTELSGLEEQLETSRARKTEEGKRMEELTARRNEAGRIADALQDYQKKIKPLEEAYGRVKSLDNLANGNNKKRLVFEQYVLAGYFEEILRAANVRLSKMTEGRYELKRASEVSDGRTKDSMEMLVMDYYTGKSRSVKTLSGGESFKASLSLALGMSDVIQAQSGGIRVEALFVDEGFGALDAESLDQACSVLAGLVGRDKMVGIISHVPELRERIGNQILVEKTNHGSYVKMCV